MSYTLRQKTYPRCRPTRLRDIVQTQLNVEMAVTEEMMNLVVPILAVHPWRHRITLVPEREGEVTTEGGLNVIAHRDRIAECAKYIHDHNIHVSLFIDPDEEQIRASVMDGVDMIEINTAAYAEGRTRCTLTNQSRCDFIGRTRIGSRCRTWTHTSQFGFVGPNSA